jgi:hypothetical protein
MEEDHFVIASRHVVLPDAVEPVQAFISITGEIISDIDIIPPAADYNEALQYLAPGT